MNGFNPEGYKESAQGGKKQSYTATYLENAMRSGEILQATAYMCDSDHNLLVSLGCMRGVIPRVEGAIGIEEGTTRDIALISRVGKTVCFTVKEINIDEYGKPYALLSRRSAQQICRDEYINKLSPGDVIPAKITHLESFGAFCDIGCGNIALLPIDSISVSRISHPADRFCSGEDIFAAIKNIDPLGRITLSHKELLGTWEENAALISQGQTVSGIVRSVESYGIFVELMPNLAGLAEPKEGVTAGQTASVFIKSIIPEKMKVKLIIIDTFGQAEPSPSHYFISEGHINTFVYSAESSSKVIKTIF